MSLKRALAAFLPFFRQSYPKPSPPSLGLKTSGPYQPIGNHQMPARTSPDAAVWTEYQTFRTNTGRGWPDYIAYLTNRADKLQAEITKLQEDLAVIAAEERFIP